jgi:hypothetical protein
MLGEVSAQCLSREFGNGNHDLSRVTLQQSWRFGVQFANQRAFREKPKEFRPLAPASLG